MYMPQFCSFANLSVHVKTYEAMVAYVLVLQAIRAFSLKFLIVCRDLACFFTLSYTDVDYVASVHHSL